jgi:hypothetical protein
MADGLSPHEVRRGRSRRHVTSEPTACRDADDAGIAERLPEVLTE